MMPIILDPQTPLATVPLSRLLLELAGYRNARFAQHTRRAHYTRVCYAAIARLGEVTDAGERRYACVLIMDAAAAITDRIPGAVWSAVLDAACKAGQAYVPNEWHVVDASPFSAACVRLIDRLRHHATDRLSLALLRRYTSPTLRRLVVTHGLGDLTPPLAAAVLASDTATLQALGARRAHECGALTRLRHAACRVLLERLEAVDPEDPHGCAPLAAYLTLRTQLQLPDRRGRTRPYPWGKRVLRALARIARHHDVHRHAYPRVGHGAGCGVVLWIEQSVWFGGPWPTEAAEVLRLGLPHSLGLAAEDEWYQAPGVLGLVASDAVGDCVAIGVARRLSASEWHVSERALVARPAIRADPLLRARLARSEDVHVHCVLARDEPRATLGDRLRRIIALDGATALEAITADLETAKGVLVRADLLPLLRHPAEGVRRTAQSILHHLK